MRAPFLRPALIGAGMVLMAGSSAVTAAQTAAPASWRIVTILRHCGGRDSLLSVTATGPRDAWAVGQPNGGGAYCGADVEHWDGLTARVPGAGDGYGR